MPIQTNLNVAPYNDDYNANNNYYRIIFKPTVAVQARELTQVQSILQNQIESFANWAFQNGDIVAGCGINDLSNISFTRLSDYDLGGNSINTSLLSNTIVVSANTNLSARVLASFNGFALNYPNTNIIYLQYTGTGSNASTNNIQTFSNTDQLVFYQIPPTGNVIQSNNKILTANAYSNTLANTFTSGNAHGITVGEGIVFINGTFVRIEQPLFGLVNPFSTNAGNNVVGFVAYENIITADQDPTLYDNSLGYPNVNAPGADRLQINLGLLSLDANTALNTQGFNPIATYSYGSLVSVANATSNVYSIVSSAIADRIYDEAGNYVVNPFAVTTISQNSGLVASPNTYHALAKIGSGTGYAQGQKVNIVKNAYVDVRRGVDTVTKSSQIITFNYGNYFVLDEVSGAFNGFDSALTVDLYDTVFGSISNRTFLNLTPSTTANVTTISYTNANGTPVVATKIGTANMRCFSYNSGSVGANTAQYNLHVFNIQVNPGYNINKINSVFYNGTYKAVGDLVYNGISNASNDNQFFNFGVNGIQNLRDTSNNNYTEYNFRTEKQTQLYSNGIISIVLNTSATGGLDQLPFGAGTLNNIAAENFNVILLANGQSNTLVGTVSISSTNTYVAGTSTTFNTSFSNSTQIIVGSNIRTVAGIINSTAMNVDSPFPSTLSGQSYSKFYPAGKIQPINAQLADTPSYVSVVNSTAFSVSLGTNANTAIPVSVIYDTLRTSVVPAQKVINKNRFVKIDTTFNPTGPWCLGYVDIHKVDSIYGSYSTSGANLSSSFILDTGQKDTYYGLGYLYPAPGYSVTPGQQLLVQLDYFSVNAASGAGVFTVESYPIDDINTSNVNAIQTWHMPLYVDSAGNMNNLRDVVDFRPVMAITASDTGYCNTANSSQVTTAIALATINPNTVSAFIIPSSGSDGLNVPSYGGMLQASYTQYLGRSDLVYITPDNVLKLKEGVSSLSPTQPLFPDNAMALSVLNIPPYPSLTSDQLDALFIINKTSKNLIRDTSTSISPNLVTNRGYTMKDIGILDQRITNLEYYVSLNLLQQSATNMIVTDSNGLNRFKNGIFADPFNDFSYSALSNPEFSIAIDSKNQIARPKIVREVINIKFNSGLSSNVQKTGRSITLPYVEAPFVVQPYATKYRSAALVAFAWNGTLIVIPCYDNHEDVNNTGSINTVINNMSGSSNSILGYIWGDWNTTTSTTSNTVIS
jgi:hypothetical protein